MIAIQVGVGFPFFSACERTLVYICVKDQAAPTSTQYRIRDGHCRGLEVPFSQPRYKKHKMLWHIKVPRQGSNDRTITTQPVISQVSFYLPQHSAFYRSPKFCYIKKHTNVVHKRVSHPSELVTPHQRVNVDTLLQSFIIVNKLLQYTKLIIRIAIITCTIYLNYAGTSVVSSLLATPAPPLSSHPLRRTLTITTTATRLFS